MEQIFKHIFVVVKDNSGKKYSIEIPKQQASVYRIRKIANSIQYNVDFVSGHMKKDDVLNVFRMNGIACSLKHDLKIMHMEPKVRKELNDKGVREALSLVLDVTAKYYDIKEADRKSTSRNGRQMIFKEMFCFIARTRVPRAGFIEIAETIGLKAHATALHHHKKIQAWLDNGDENIENDVDEIDRRIAAVVMSEEDKKKIEEFKLD